MNPLRTHRPIQRFAARAVCASLVILFLAGGAALAAQPKKGGRYTGKSSQGAAVSLELRGGGAIESLAIRLRYPCSRVGPVRIPEEAFEVRVRRDGSFSDTSFSLYPVGEKVIEGRQLDLWAVAKNELNGKFVTSRKATGTWRGRSALYDFNLFPENSDPIDKCDTGVVNWTARLRR